MADVVVTATEVLPGTGTLYYDGILGATVTAGQTVYLDSATSTLKLGDADDTQATAAIKGIAMNGGGSGQVCRVATGGSIDPGFTVTVGTRYVQSGTAGGICPIADLAPSDWVTDVGYGTTASNLVLDVRATGVQVP